MANIANIVAERIIMGVKLTFLADFFVKTGSRSAKVQTYENSKTEKNLVPAKTLFVFLC